MTNNFVGVFNPVAKYVTGEQQGGRDEWWDE